MRDKEETQSLLEKEDDGLSIHQDVETLSLDPKQSHQ